MKRAAVVAVLTTTLVAVPAGAGWASPQGCGLAAAPTGVRTTYGTGIGAVALALGVEKLGLTVLQPYHEAVREDCSTGAEQPTP